ncbi:MAG: ankyrin repeat domain-containing protein [Planctomycetes bacterium]|nr:ankyrin repeat domain-containing protein [Planctomycetota bacterium]
MTTLREAVRAGDRAGVEAAWPRSTAGVRGAAIMEAAGAGRLEMLDLMLGRDTSALRLYVGYALVPAVRGGHRACLERLIAARAVHYDDVQGRNAAADAAARGDVEVLALLAARGVKWDHLLDVPAEDAALAAAADGASPLLNAIRHGHLAAVEFVLAQGASPNLPTLAGRSPLEMAEALGQAAIAERLRAAGGAPLDRDALNLYDAARFGFLDVARAKVVDETDVRRGAAFWAAASRGHVEVIHLLAPWAGDKAQEALEGAAARDRVGAMRALLALGAAPDKLGFSGMGALHWAAGRGALGALRELLRAGAKVDLKSKGDRWTPLHRAVDEGRVEAARLLLEAGADPNALAADGSTPLSLARQGVEAERLVPLLEAAGARAGARKDLVKALKAKLKKEARKAARPVTEVGDGPPAASKFGGAPLLTAAAPRPIGRGGVPLPLLVQVDLREHPEPKERQAALLQVFFDPDGPPHGVARLIDPDAPAVTDAGPALPARRITGWGKPASDHPSRGDDPARPGPALTDDEQAVLRDLNLGGDKLGGWPDWVQDPVYPACPECQAPMTRLLLQVEGGRHVAVSLGDAGVGYVLACPDHAGQVSFRSQSC